jgi:cation:H+ antiporter
MIVIITSILLGIVALVWSADRFVESSASSARHFGMPSLLIGMIVVGFGTSAPEMAVSMMAASAGNTAIGLGNAYGSNIANIALILGLAAFIRPIIVRSNVLRKELPILAAVTALAAYQASDGQLTRNEALVLLMAFAAILGWSVHTALRHRGDALARDTKRGLDTREVSVRRALFWLAVSLVLLIVSSRVLVWGAVEFARFFQVSDLVIGLTIVAIGTSLPELASTVAAIRRGENDMAMGNVLGSNLFNTLLVVGVAVAIQPTVVPPEILYRDIAVMGALTLALFVVCFGSRGRGRVQRFEGAALLSAFGGYSAYLFASTIG